MCAKVLHILNAIEFSGAETMLVAAARSFAEHGLELHALSTGETPGVYAPSMSDAGYVIHHIPFRESPRYFRAIYRYLRTEEFDLVHIHPERAFVWHTLVARIARVPTVVRTIHNVFEFNGSLRVRKMAERWLAAHLLGLRYIAISKSVQQVEWQRFRNPTIIVPNWVETNKFRPTPLVRRQQLRSELSFSEDSLVVVSIGSCTDVKNHGAILQAIASLANDFPRLVYLHIGAGPLLAQEIELAHTLGIDSRVRFHGQTDRISDILGAADIFAMPSRYEGVGIAAMEAASCGVPTVAYWVHGLRDVVQHGRTGILVEPHLEAFTLGIKALLQNGELRVSMGNAASEYALAHFDMERSLSALYRLYAAQDVADSQE